jgi:molybdopterin molybdotransferase
MAAELSLSIALQAETTRAELAEQMEFLRAVSDGAKVTLAGSQDSSALTALAAANGLIDRPAGAAAVKAGDAVPVYRLQNG